MLNHTELKERERPPFIKSILIIDDNPDIALTFKRGLEAENNNKSENNNIFFEVFAYNDPILALSEFKPSFYDLMLIDINMPEMNGFEFCIKALEIDVNPKVCFMSSGLINQEALRVQYPSLSVGCFIGKPITIEDLIKRVKAELEYSPSELRFDDILKLVEYIPITGSLPSNGRFAKNITMDSMFYFESLQRKGSFRDIIRLINTELAKIVGQQNRLQREEQKATFLNIEQRYKQLREIGCSYPIEYLLFDFCLASLDEDFLDAALYLAHSFHILGFSKLFNLLLSVIVNEKLAHDRDVRRLIILLARAIEPRNAEAYIDTYGITFRRRYELYREGLRKEGI
ncbi:MAG TPA: response regulator [Nitrososphaeraceae archaeon]|nr:response regulator [Nitrososphaeraceae archaeon]